MTRIRPKRTSTCQARVRVGVDKQFHVEQVTNRLEIKHQDSLEEHHIGRIDGDGFLRTTKAENENDK